ncbi:MAG TPA: heavy-metal-associated domain-containing protein [Gemmatimonadaceae bacterium]
MTKLEMQISGMTCGHCVRAVSKALEGVDGVQVEQVQVGSAVVHYDEAKVSRGRIAEVVEDAGYAVTDAG